MKAEKNAQISHLLEEQVHQDKLFACFSREQSSVACRWLSEGGEGTGAGTEENQALKSR